MKKHKKVSDVLSIAAALMGNYQDNGIEAYTVICIHEAGYNGKTHNTEAQKFFRSIFPDNDLWTTMPDGSWDWESRLFALLIAAECAKDLGL